MTVHSLMFAANGVFGTLQRSRHSCAAVNATACVEADVDREVGERVGKRSTPLLGGRPLAFTVVPAFPAVMRLAAVAPPRNGSRGTTLRA